MDPKEAEWFRTNLKLGDDWSVCDKEYCTSPLMVRVSVSFVGVARCPICRRECPRYDTRERKWRDLDYGHAKCIIVAKIPRVRCETCGIHEIRVSWAGSVSKLSLSFEQKIVSKIRNTPISVVSREFGIYDRTVWNIAKHYADRLMRSLDLSGLESFCIDETSSEKGHNYITNVIDPSCGAVIFSTHGRDGSVLTEFKVWLIHHNGDPDGIKTVCCDMSPAFVNGISREFPGADIVFDPFHIIHAANDMLESVRRKSGIKGKTAKGLRFGFLMNKESLAETGDFEQRVKEVLGSYKDIGRGYGVKGAVRDFYDIENPDHARVFLRALAGYCVDTDVEDIVSFGELIYRHYDGILAWYGTNMNNGYCEGTNSVIQSMKCSARGFTNIENMISLIYLKSSIKHPSLRNALVLNRI